MKIKNVQEIEKTPDLRISKFNKRILKNFSLWRLMATFAIVNLVIVNIINYWQPINHPELKNRYDRQQKIILSLYDLQNYFNEFKNNPDQKAYNLIQQTVNLNYDVDKINNQNSDVTSHAEKLNTNIEKIIDSIPLIKLLQQNLDKLNRSIKSVKFQIFDDFDKIKPELRKNLFITADKIEDVLARLKFNQTSELNLIDIYQKNIEDIGFDIEQLNNIIDSKDSNDKSDNITRNLSNIFDDLSNLMPSIVTLSDTNMALLAARNFQNELINSFKAKSDNYIDQIDDKTIIIITILLSNLLLLSIITFVKLSEKTKRLYSNYKNKNEVYYLSHVPDENSQNNELLENSDGLEVNVSELTATKNTLKNDNSVTSEDLNHLKQAIINDCYILQNNLDKIDKFYTNYQGQIHEDHKIPTHILLILYKISNNLLDKAIILDKKLTVTDNIAQTINSEQQETINEEC